MQGPAVDRHENFLSLFLKHEADLRAFIGSLVRDPHLRDDVFQEVALTLWRQIDEYDPARPFGAWARGIAANKIMQQWDRVARRPVAFPPETIQAVLDAYDRTEASESARADALRHCLERLPDKSRELLRLRYENSIRPEEIARAIESTLEAVYKALSRIRQKLLECIQRQMVASEEGT
jgi:RNA polymerase sigma-70 factor (ECF subfamily)